MNIEKYYTFSSKLSSTTVQAHALGLSSKEDDTGLFDQHRLIQGVYDGISFPVVFKQEYGKKLEDVLDTGWVNLYLISNKMKTVLEENALTGWKTFAVQVIDKKGREIQNYHGLSITGRCGKIDYSKSEIIKDTLLGKYYKGLHVGLDKWDGSDFFMPEKYFGTIITNRVVEILKKNNITNIRLENLMEIKTPDFALLNQ
ncbi:MAG: hypothetical protein LBG80_07980 [Bacteroidales bacterium]|jgi:hypothetical protein|nr:hypothetical protein [Bacteroidales bacterium]